ncbi:hypothetical protein MGYG_01152 [Nannizzia gypsea CBS 118893]|uniref:Uncharacterized protein n=1 Tax=Arthroderma gypseum (strain ATCC MYA-4604 / CBS 118893) TaxID=535722 RepID=E5QYZ1_ARTGP|nr:hypothetical protein MGYG_01152 [Nannizzia gypsea CBS 118893]EFQ98114.1 hypothetical protein MGYG_01152 [Nannizzia gypsea CBS 118893]
MAPRKARASKKAKVVETPEPSIEAGAETSLAEVEAVGRPRRVGCLMLFVGNHEDKGEDVDYWRVRLGWAGDEEPRDIYHRYEAVGDPTQAGEDAQLPPLRFVWVFETGEWVDKAVMLRERAQKAQKEEEERQAASLAASAEAKTGRGGYRRARAQPVASDAAPDAGHQDAAKRVDAEGRAEGEDGAGHQPPSEPEVKKRGRKPVAAKAAPKRKRGQDDGNEQAKEPAAKRRIKTTQA